MLSDKYGLWDILREFSQLVRFLKEQDHFLDSVEIIVSKICF